MSIEDLTIPRKAFITFEQEEGHLLMKKYRKLQLGNSASILNQADEPSNI